MKQHTELTRVLDAYNFDIENEARAVWTGGLTAVVTLKVCHGPLVLAAHSYNWNRHIGCLPSQSGTQARSGSARYAAMDALVAELSAAGYV